jgi:hypothetical protein
MTARVFRYLLLSLGLILWGLTLDGCSHDEDSLSQPGPRAETIGLTYSDPIEIEVNSARHWALLLHDSSSTRGSAVQLVDLQRRSVIASKILSDYQNVYDIEFLGDNEACFAGKLIDGTGYAVQFLSLPNLTLESSVATADTAGAHGYLAVDSAGGFVYYSHAGGGNKDAVYMISIATKQLVDADNDGHAPYSLDNGMVHGIFSQPGRMIFDPTAGKLMVANLGDDYVTVLDTTVWGHLVRGSGYTFPMPGIYPFNTLAGGLSAVRPSLMRGSGEFDVFAGMSNGTAFMARFGADFTTPYLVRETGRTWTHPNGDIRIHPRGDVVSAFILQRDSSGYGIGQYGLNNFNQVDVSPHHTRVIPDSLISAFGLDVVLDELVVGDARSPRLELISIR